MWAGFLGVAVLENRALATLPIGLLTLVAVLAGDHAPERARSARAAGQPLHPVRTRGRAELSCRPRRHRGGQSRLPEARSGGSCMGHRRRSGGMVTGWTAAVVWHPLACSSLVGRPRYYRARPGQAHAIRSRAALRSLFSTPSGHNHSYRSKKMARARPAPDRTSVGKPPPPLAPKRHLGGRRGAPGTRSASSPPCRPGRAAAQP
jgi:hypothetical protein